MKTANCLRWFRRALKAARIPRTDDRGRVLHIHALRYSFAGRLMCAGIPMQKVKLFGGWDTTDVLIEIYTHLEADDARNDLTSAPLPATDEMAEVVNKLQSLAQAAGDATRTGLEAARKLLQAHGFIVERLKGLEPSTFSLGS